MGTRVWAQIEVYPFDRAVLCRSEPGRAFLSEFDGVVADHECDDSLDPDEDGLVSIGLHEVNYGTAYFDELDLPRLANAAGLWYRQRDDGSVGWSPSSDLFCPDGRRFFALLDHEGNPVLAATRFGGLERLGGDVPLAERVRAYYRLGRVDLAALATQPGVADDLFAAVGIGCPTPAEASS